MSALAVFLAALVTAVATGLGVLPFLFVHRPGRTWLGLANGLAAGFMVGATLGLVGEGLQRGPWETVVGVVAGAIFVAITSRALAARPALELGALRGADARRAFLIVATMTIHSFSEGVGVGVALDRKSVV